MTITEIDEKFMREALAEARAAAAVGEVPIGAVVVRAGEIVARAHNRRELDQDPSAHAEFAAVCDAAQSLGRWRLSDCTVYVTLEPCCMCAGLMVNARVGRCVYGASDAKAAPSRPARGAWVEIRHGRRSLSWWQSRPARGAWIETLPDSHCRIPP